MKTVLHEIEIREGQEVVPVDIYLPQEACRLVWIRVMIASRIPSLGNCPMLGEYALSFKAQGATLTGDVDYLREAPSRSKHTLFSNAEELNIPLQGEKHCRGYYRDLGVQARKELGHFTSYKVRFSIQYS